LFIIHATGDKATPAEVSWWLSQKFHSVFELLRRMEETALVKKVKDSLYIWPDKV